MLLAACETREPERPLVGAPSPGNQPRYFVDYCTGECELVQNIGDRVFFTTNGSALTAEARATIERQAAWLKQHQEDWMRRAPSLTILIEGHCDDRGTSEYNLALGMRRANAVRDALIALGVRMPIHTMSYGKERPAVLGSNERAWEQNRRAVTTFD
jgi:peptidoglycan-associated lipoprotein